MNHSQADDALNHELRETNEKLNAIFDASPLGIIALNLEGNVTLWSPGAEKIFGWSSEEAMGKINPTITDDGWDEFWRHFERVIKEEESTVQVLRKHRTKQGAVIDIGISAAPLLDFSGKIIGAMGVHQDITKRIKDHEALLKSEKKHRKLLETMNEGFTVQNSKGEFVYANKSFIEMIGYEKEEIIGHLWVDFLDAESKELIQNMELLDSPLLHDPFEVQWITGKGTTICTIFSPQPYFDPTDNHKSSATVITDITMLKKVQMKCLSREKELTENKIQLEEINSALRVLLKKREQDKEELEENILANVEKVVMPILAKMQRRLTGKDKVYAEMLESNLEDIISPFTKRLSFKYLNLTPTELRVAGFIKQGMTTKEIAAFMNLSPKTIEDHRKHIRKKLGISNSKINLRTQLSFIDEY